MLVLGAVSHNVPVVLLLPQIISKISGNGIKSGCFDDETNVV